MPLLRVSGHRLRDGHNREVILHGINVSGDSKLPSSPDVPSHVATNFFDGDSVSFVDRPFPLREAPAHFARLRRWGYNTIRYIFTWEAIEHEGPGRYDDEFVRHTVETLRIAKEFGFRVIMDPHQDVWSRFTGGSGAPMWTLYACGLNPENFLVTEAALVQNTWPDPTTFPTMIWATNYYRMACQVTFTLFFAGREFAPMAIIDGKSVQDYLQDHFLDAVQHLLTAVHRAGDLHDVVVGWESLNEPNRGIIGTQDLTAIPKDQRLQKGTSPTAWQAMLLGSGRSCEVETWDVGGMGPHKTGTLLVDPRGESAWLPAKFDDQRYGWKRDPGWKLGECLWAQCGVWDRTDDALLKKDYFAKDPRNNEPIDYHYFTNNWFMDFFRKYRTMIRSVHKDAIIFCQSPTLEVPPSMKGTADEDHNTVFCPHWYDGLTLMTKKWNRWFNVDVFGVLRGKYLFPALAVKLGEPAIRNCFRDQLSAMREEAVGEMGQVPCVFTETGIPYDLDDKAAYKTGDYGHQISAMDAVHYALEGARIQGFTLWNYTANNSHRWGDNWNGEDLSIYSVDDSPLPLGDGSLSASTQSLDPDLPSFSKSQASEVVRESPSTLKQTLATETMTSSSVLSEEDTTLSKRGYRAAQAFVRPWPLAVGGTVESFGFDLRTCTFTLRLEALEVTGEDAPTEVHLPEWHFPPASTHIETSGGKAVVSVEDDVQKLKWWHAAGEQSLTVKGRIRTQGFLAPAEGEPGYLEQCNQTWNVNCSLM